MGINDGGICDPTQVPAFCMMASDFRVEYQLKSQEKSYIFLIYIMVNFKHTKLETVIEGNMYTYNLGSTMINSGKQC